MHMTFEICDLKHNNDMHLLYQELVLHDLFRQIFQSRNDRMEIVELFQLFTSTQSVTE